MKNKSLWLTLILTTVTLVPMVTFNVVDTFFIAHDVGKANDNENFDFDNNPTEPTSGEELFDHTSVTYTKGYRDILGYNATYHLVDIKIKSLSNLRSKLAVDAEGNYGVNITQNMSDMLSDINSTYNKSVLAAITGDYAFWSTSRRGYVVRNGTVYRNNIKSRSAIDMVIKKDRTVSFLKEVDYKLDAGVGEESNEFYQIYSFGPHLMENDEILINEDTEINGNNLVNNQRAAVGFVAWNHFMFLVTECGSRTSSELKGFRLYDCAELLQELGCHSAYNLDGGYSSGIAYNNEVVFKPHRAIGDILYVVPDEE